MNIERNFKGAKSYLDTRTRLYFSRKRAHSIRDEVIKKKGYEIVTPNMMKSIKKYSKDRFGSTSFWPWLALYMEVRGEFVPGCIPYDYYRILLKNELNPDSVSGIAECKTFDYRLFPDFSVQPLIIRISDNFYDAEMNRMSSEVAINKLLQHNKEIVVKEDYGLGGSKVNFFKPKDIDINKYKKEVNLIFQPVIDQHEELSKLNKTSVNTLRVLTFLNNQGDVELKAAYLRFGSDQSRVDNRSAGGGFCFVQTDGRLESKAYSSLILEIGSSTLHNNVEFSSVAIPNYHQAIEKCKKAHEKFPYGRLVGWDVAIDKTSKPVLLEWNLNPQIWYVEALKGPLWKGDSYLDEIISKAV